MNEQKNDQKYLHSENEFDVNGTAETSYTHNSRKFTVQEERVPLDNHSDATILRILDGGDIKAAGTYLNGLEERGADDYDGHGEALNEFDEFDNPLHAVNQITGGKLDETTDFSENSQGYEIEGVQALGESQ